MSTACFRESPIRFIVLVLPILVSACTTNSKVHFPLEPCKEGSQPDHCIATLFSKSSSVLRRDREAFPERYLELSDQKVRESYCAGKDADCTSRLQFVANYFNPSSELDGQGNSIPNNSKIGVALEGGGSKAAPFALGTLAGLQELGLLSDRVGAISSISGGSYAGSYYFNRLYDRYVVPGSNPGEPEDWFRSCIPDYFIDSSRFELIKDQAEDVRCWERRGSRDRGYNAFARPYEFLGHVWMNHDLLRGDTPGNLSTIEDLRVPEFGNLSLLVAETAASIPLQFLARTMFRWPINSAPSKLAYKLGLERQYGYSPHDWHEAGNTDIAHFVETVTERRKTRTVGSLKALEKIGAPFWIIGTTAPSAISGIQWLVPSPRDPVRQQFELSWNGYGSGTYGYALMPPDAQFDFLGRNANGMPILDAVTDSAAFFDEDQTQISRQPFRLLAGVGLHFLNITWFSEIRNYNVSDESRSFAKLLPWPAYLAMSTAGQQSPYIHLQDGGNAENTGILPLLRRGYKTIVYAHGTQDDKARWESICHLKNQLELDGKYMIRSNDLERLIQKAPEGNGQQLSKRSFATYIDALCSSQLDGSDLVVFDQNPERAESDRIPAVAKLYCGRLGYRDEAIERVERRTSPDPIYQPCPEFLEKLSRRGGSPTVGTEGYLDSEHLFFNWPIDTTLTFDVFRGDPLAYLREDPPEDKRLSTVISIIPGIAWNDVQAQTLPPNGVEMPKSWAQWCALGQSTRKSLRIRQCYGPDDKFVAAPGERNDAGTGLPCSALAHVLEDECVQNGGYSRPEFPQDDFIMQTLHATYTSYAAYFDLARHQVRHALCSRWPNRAGPLPETCKKT